jgi:hypothetical protein
MGDYPDHFNPKHPRIKVLMSLRSRQNIGRRIRYASIAALLLSGATGLAVAHSSNDSVPIFQEFSDPEGRFANLNTAGPTEMASNAFFQMG